jgi:L-asparaginase / beta-aspartyl-peptidase
MKFTIAIHGGAGTLRPEDFPETQAKEAREHLRNALAAGAAILERDGPALLAVEAAVKVLEDSPHFNAGHGAVFTHEGTIELEASIMDGRNLAAGAIAGLRHVKNPITAARMVMEQSQHVFLVGDGAEAFAKSCGVEMVDAGYFHTDRRLRELKALQALEAAGTKRFGTLEASDLKLANAIPDKKFGTVGAVACDRAGHLAAATSTGGLTNKRWGRIGDCPIIGAGTYAEDATCAVSATGHGEYFIRACVASDIAARMRYAGVSLEEAANQVVGGALVKLGGKGGVIAVDTKGNITLPFNTNGMYRGAMREGEAAYVGIYRD